MTIENKTQTEAQESLKNKIISFVKKPNIRLGITVVLVLALIISGLNIIKNFRKDSSAETTKTAKEVQVQAIGNKSESRIETIGTVKADTQVAVKALANGTVRSVQFEVGDKISTGKVLANLSNDAVMSNMINAQTNLVNLERNATFTKQLTTEMLKQAEFETERAEQAVSAATIALESAKDNLKNSKTNNTKNDADIKSNAIISIANDLNAVFSLLQQINTVIQTNDDNNQVAGIENTLAALDPSSLSVATKAYNSTYASHQALAAKQFDANTITQGTKEAIAMLASAKSAVDATIEVLENTVSSADFPQAALNGQKERFIGLRSSIVGTQTSAEMTLQALQNIGLSGTQQYSAYERAVSVAETQLATAKLGYENSLIGLQNAKIGADRDLLSIKSSLDNARSQLNLINVQASDLSINAPISGVVTEKNVELGDEIFPGQTIAIISQTAKLIIETDLPAEDVVNIKAGQSVYINPDKGNSTGVIGQIYPTADPINKKIRVEILVDAENNLIAESFVNISIPVENKQTDGVSSFFVPLKAVSISPSESYLFIVENDKAKKVLVEIIKVNGENAEIKADLPADTKIIIDGNKLISDGEEIKITN